MAGIKLDWSRQTDDWGFFRHEESITSTSEPIMFQSGMRNLSVAMHPANGQTARVEYTLSSTARVEAGTARWIAWDLGDVTSSKADALMSCVTALRGVSGGGTAIMELIAS